MTPEEFSKAFATAFTGQNAAGLRAMLTADAQVVTLTGAVADDAEQAGRTFEQEFSGIFQAAKLITGRNRLQSLGPGLVIVHQRYVVMGAQDEAGLDLPRFGAAVTAVMLQTTKDWLVVSLTLSSVA